MNAYYKSNTYILTVFVKHVFIPYTGNDKHSNVRASYVFNTFCLTSRSSYLKTEDQFSAIMRCECVCLINFYRTRTIKLSIYELFSYSNCDAMPKLCTNAKHSPMWYQQNLSRRTSMFCNSIHTNDIHYTNCLFLLFFKFIICLKVHWWISQRQTKFVDNSLGNRFYFQECYAKYMLKPDGTVMYEFGCHDSQVCYVVWHFSQLRRKFC